MTDSFFSPVQSAGNLLDSDSLSLQFLNSPMLFLFLHFC